jgi:hypothetical protein
VFSAVAAVSVLAAASVFLIRPEDLRGRAPTRPGNAKQPGLRALLGDRRIVVLFLAVALFHLANAPVMPLVGLTIARLGGIDTQVAAVVLVAQAVMIPVAVAAEQERVCRACGEGKVEVVGWLVRQLGGGGVMVGEDSS